MTKEELLATADEFHRAIDRGADIEFSRELSFWDDLEEEERGEIDKLVSDVASESITRLVQWFITGSDKQIIARVVCLEQLWRAKHGGWLESKAKHDIGIKSIRAMRDSIKREMGLIIR